MVEKSSGKIVHPVAGIVLGILAVSTASVFIRFSQREVSSIVIAAYRLSLATLILLPFAWHRIKCDAIELTRNQRWILLFSGVLLAFHFASWITSLSYTTVTSSVVLVSTTPLWVAIFSPILLGERIRKVAAIGLAVAIIGAVVVGLSESCEIDLNYFSCQSAFQILRGKAFLGDILALIGALCASGYLMAGRKLRGHLPLLSYTFFVYGTAAVILVVMALISGKPWVGFSGTTYLWLIALAVIPQLIGHSSFNWALKYLPAAFISILILGEPVGSSILAMIFLKEMPGLLEIGGGALILSGILIASLSQNKASGQGQ